MDDENKNHARMDDPAWSPQEHKTTVINNTVIQPQEGEEALLEARVARLGRATELLGELQYLLPEALNMGDAVEIVFPDGTRRPAVAVAVWNAEEGYGNFQVFLDGSNDKSTLELVTSEDWAQVAVDRGMYWATSIRHAAHADDQESMFWLWPGQELEDLEDEQD